MLLKEQQAKVKRVRLTAVDPDGNSKSKTITVYDTTPEEAISLVERAMDAPTLSSDEADRTPELAVSSAPSQKA